MSFAAIKGQVLDEVGQRIADGSDHLRLHCLQHLPGQQLGSLSLPRRPRAADVVAIPSEGADRFPPRRHRSLSTTIYVVSKPAALGCRRPRRHRGCHCHCCRLACRHLHRQARLRCFRCCRSMMLARALPVSHRYFQNLRSLRSSMFRLRAPGDTRPAPYRYPGRQIPPLSLSGRRRGRYHCRGRRSVCRLPEPPSSVSLPFVSVKRVVSAAA